MSRNKLLAIVTALSLSGALYACGSDDETNPDGGAGTAGTTGGSGGKAGSGGKGGSSSGGKGGSAGKGGESTTGGTENVAGENGNGGDSGSGGAPEGGMGGTTEGEGGSGGEGGAGAPDPVLTLTEACTAACDPAHSLSACTSTLDACIATCEGYPALVDIFAADATDAATLNAEYLTAITCMANHLPTTAQYACAENPPPPDPPATVNLWSPVEHTVCEDEICKWTCDDMSIGTFGGDNTVVTRCCPP